MTEADELRPTADTLPNPQVSFGDEEDSNRGSSPPINDFAVPKLAKVYEDGKIKTQVTLPGERKVGKYIYYDSPHYEETGPWIPVSVPPMTADDHEEWIRGFALEGSYLPVCDNSWNQFDAEKKEMTMWEVVSEMLTAAHGKMKNLKPRGIITESLCWAQTQHLELAWKEMVETLTEAKSDEMNELLEREPPDWLPDSSETACMLCSSPFHPIMCSRHHCRFCGGIFCNGCSKGKSLLPSKFRTCDPQKVCDVCYVRLESIQPYLMDSVSRASQLPTHDLTDFSTLRSWLNFPWGHTMEYEIYKAANIIHTYSKVVSAGLEKSIPSTILKQAKGLAILTIAKVGIISTYSAGTGLVIALREDGSWSPPSAISSFGIGWGAQAGGELIDFIIVLRTNAAVKIFSGDAHLSIDAGANAAVGVLGRALQAKLLAGSGLADACYTYSLSKGAFLGCSLEGSMIMNRSSENCRFYGSSSITASDILFGSLQKPPAAALLYRALSYLFQKLESNPSSFKRPL